MYNHYINFGKNEGRKPCADNTSQTSKNSSANETTQPVDSTKEGRFELNVMYLDKKGLPYMYTLDWTAPGYTWKFYDFAIATLKDYCKTTFANQPGSQYAPAITSEDAVWYDGTPLCVYWVRGVNGYDKGTFDTRGIPTSCK